MLGVPLVSNIMAVSAFDRCQLIERMKVTNSPTLIGSLKITWSSEAVTT